MANIPPEGGYQPQGPGYPPQGQGYPPQGQGYPPQGPGYPPGAGYPSPGGGYPPPAPGYLPPPRQRTVRPGRIWYLLPLAMLAAGIAWLIIGIASVASTVNGLQRVPLPGGGTVTLTHSGGYTIYYEGPGAQSGNIPGFHVRVAPTSAGTAVSLTQYGSTVTYHIGSHEGRAVLALHVSKPGRFAVTATGAPANGADLALGGSIGSGLVGALLPAIPLIVLGVLGALALFIVRIVRSRSVRRGYAWGGPPSPPA